MLTATDVIDRLGLQPLPDEGGFFKETYKSGDSLAVDTLPLRYTAPHSASTAIYALFTEVDFSALHRLQTDEIFHFYLGDPLEMLLLNPDGTGALMHLGNDLLAGERPQQVVPRGVWQGSRILSGKYGFALVGTTMAPGFEWGDFELGLRDDLLSRYPDFAAAIIARTRG